METIKGKRYGRRQCSRDGVLARLENLVPTPIRPLREFHFPKDVEVLRGDSVEHLMILNKGAVFLGDILEGFDSLEETVSDSTLREA
jgi:hypothetical protein